MHSSSRSRPLRALLRSALAIALTLATSLASAQPAGRAPAPFSVVFDDCTEFAGLGTLAATQIEGRLPAGYVAASFGPGVAGVVARAARCERVSVDGGPAERATVSQIGINLVPPDGTGDINNYSLLYVTDSRALAQRLRHFGLPAHYAPGMVYEVNPAAAALEFYAQVAVAPGFIYFLQGPVVDPVPGTEFPFLANWWHSGRAGRMKMSTAIPVFGAGQADVALYNSRSSPLGELLAANRTVFPLLSVRGKFGHAVMTVSLER